MRPAILVASLALGALAGCLEQQLVPCGDKLCVGATTCVSNHCATSSQVDACVGLGDGDLCNVDGSVGRCDGGVCLPAGCGNLVVDPDEACDDGNVESGDGCRADCRKIEMCGDGAVDDGEGCDDGNANPADGCDACVPTEWTASALIGSNALATTLALGRPADAVYDRNGILFICDTGNNRIRRLHPNGTMSVVAGTGEPGFSGDGGPATSARFSSPQGIAIDGVGNIYVADSGNARIRKISRNGIITTFAGTGVGTFGGDDGPATAAGMNQPVGIAVDGLGNVFVADTNSHRVRKIDTNGIITTYAGTGTSGFSGDDGPATAAQLDSLRGIALDPAGNLYIATRGRVRRVTTDGEIDTIAGTGTIGNFSGDGGPATSAELGGQGRIAVDAMGRVYVVDRHNHRVRRFPIGGNIDTIAGSGTTGSSGGGFGGDGGAATSAQLRDPDGIAIDPAGNIAIADAANHRIRGLSTAGTIATAAGNGENGFTADGGPALSARLLAPAGVTVDPAGNVYFTEQLAHRVRRIDPTGTIATVAGRGTQGNTGDNGPATQAQVSQPYGVAFGGGALYIADTLNHVIRRVDSSGTITRVAGTGTAGFADNANALAGQLSSPAGLAYRGGELYIADRGNHRVRKLTAAGALETLAGTGTSGFSGDTGAATAAQLFSPANLAFDKDGNLLIADANNNRIRMVDGNGDIFTIAGTGTSGFSGDDGPATGAQLANPRGLAVDAAGNIYIGDPVNRRIRKIDTGGDITTFAGTGTRGFSGDGGAAASARLDTPEALAFDPSGRLVFSDAQLDGMFLVRRIDTDQRIFTVAGLIDPAGIGPISTGALARPIAIVRDAAFTLFAGGTAGVVELLRPGATSVEIVAGRYPQTVPAAYAGGTPATSNLARFQGNAFGSVDGIAYDAAASRIFIAQATTHGIHVITIVDPSKPSTWTIAPFANTAGMPGTDDGAAATARFRAPTGLYLHGSTLYVADTGNHTIRSIDLSGGLGAATVQTIAGTPAVRGYFGDGVPATTALLHDPAAITRCPNGDLFVADTANHRIRRIANGTITTVIGDNAAGSAGEGTPSIFFPVDTPLGIACDTLGNVFVTSTNVVRLLPANAAGIVDGMGPVQTIYALPPRDTFPASAAACLTGITSVDPTTVQLVDSCTGLLVELTRAPVSS